LQWFVLQAASCQAQRCYFVAHTHLAAGRRPEAAALFQRTLEQIKTAVDRHQVLTMNHPGSDAPLLFTLTMIRLGPCPPG
jgi:RNA-binding signal recognition particle 68